MRTQHLTDEERRYIINLRRRSKQLTPERIQNAFNERYRRDISHDTINRYCRLANMPFEKGSPIQEGDPRLHRAYKKTYGDFDNMLKELDCNPRSLVRRLETAGFTLEITAETTKIIPSEGYETKSNAQ